MEVRIERSAGGVVLRRIDGQVHALLIRDSQDKWGLPKGHLEAGERPLDAALREVREETGLGPIEPGCELGEIDWYFRHDGHVIHKFCTFFVMWSSSGVLVPARGEGITECAWVDLDEAVVRIAYANAREMLERTRALMDEGEITFDI